MTVELTYAAANIVGESIVWDCRNDRLVWVDIVAKTIHAFDPNTGAHESWQAPDFVTSVGLREDGGAVVGLMKSICLWDFGDRFEMLAHVEQDMPGNRLNEGVVGPDGAFWIGTMQNNIGEDGAPLDITADTGRLYRCTPQGQVEPLCDDRFGITNTFVWSGDRLITADSVANIIYSYAFDDESHTLSDRRGILTGYERGLPDGSCMDVEGYIWNCRVVGGSCLIRMNPEGEIDRVVDLPCSWPTSCCFGGEGLDRLFVTSARFTMDEDHLDKNPQEGGLFVLDVGVVGQECHRFGSGSG